MPKTLSDYYTSMGQALPSIQGRTADATKAGITNYAGTAEQNTQLLSYLSKQPKTTTVVQPQIPQLAATSTPQPIAIDSLNVKQPTIPTAPPLPTEIQPSQNFAQSLLDSVQTQETALQKEANGLSSKIYNLIPELGGQSDALAKAQEAAGVTSIKNNLNTINNEINFKMAELNKDDISLAKSLQDIEDKPVALEFITGEQASVQRNAQIARAWKNAEINTLNARALAVRGDLELAQDMAQKAVDAKYKPIEEAINLYQKQLDSLKPLLDREETKIASERQLKIDLALTDWKEKKDNEKAVADLIMKAAGQGADQATLKRAGSAKTPQEAAIALGQWAGDYWQNKALEDAYKKQQSANAQTQIVNGNYVGAMEKYDATPAQLAQAIAMKETNGGRNITAGASGELASKYQYMPETWRTTSQAYNLAVNGKNSPLPFSLDVEDKVTEWQIAKWKAEGKTNAQIFAMWNGGPGAANNWQNRVGVNSRGVKYDVPSYVSGASKFLADIVGVGGIAGNQQFSPEVLGYVEQINSGKLKLVNVPQNMRGQVASAMSTIESNDPVKKAQIDIAVEGVNKLDAALNRIGGLAGLGGANIAGSNWLSRVDFSNFMTGDKNVVLGYIDNILSESTLNQLIKAKEAGATFGALSNQELGLLERSATVLNKWAIRDSITGALEGFSVPEENVIKELNTIKSKLQMAIPSDYQAPASEADKALDTFEKIKNSGSSVPEDVFLSNLPGINK